MAKVCVFVVLYSYTLPEYGYIFTPDHWVCCEQLRSKTKVLKTMSIKLRVQQASYHKPCLIFFWQLLYETKLGLRIDKIMSNHYVYAHEFALGLERNYWTQ